MGVWLQGMKKQEGGWGRSPPPAPPPHMQGRSVSRCKRNSLLCLCGTGLCCCLLFVGLKGCWLQEEATLKKKQAGGGLLFVVSCPPQMHWMSLHRLAARGCNLNVFLLLGLQGVAARGGNLKKNKLEGGWGGGRSASPPDALDVFTSVWPRDKTTTLMFFCARSSGHGCLFGGNLKKKHKLEGGGRSGSPQMLGCLFVCLFCFVFVLFLFVCLFVCLSVCLFVCLSVCLFVCLSVCLSVCLFVCLLLLFVLYYCLFCTTVCFCITTTTTYYYYYFYFYFYYYYYYY